MVNRAWDRSNSLNRHVLRLLKTITGNDVDSPSSAHAQPIFSPYSGHLRTRWNLHTACARTPASTAYQQELAQPARPCACTEDRFQSWYGQSHPKHIMWCNIGVASNDNTAKCWCGTDKVGVAMATPAIRHSPPMPMWDPDGSHVGSPCWPYMSYGPIWDPGGTAQVGSRWVPCGPHMGPIWGICGILCGVGVGPIWAGPDGDDVGYISERCGPHMGTMWATCGNDVGHMWGRCGLHSVSRNSEYRPETGCLGRNARMEIYGRQTVDGIR